MSNRLEEFEKKLYKRDGETEKKQKSYEVYKEEDLFAPRPGWEEGRRFLFLAGSGFKIALILLALLAVGVAAVFGYLYFNKGAAFDAKKVKVSILGPENIQAGDEVSFSVAYKNDSDIVLRDAELIFEWPERSMLAEEFAAPGSLFVKYDFGTIVPFQEKTVTIKGRIFGLRGEDKTVKALFRYRPENINSTIEGGAAASVRIVSTPLSLKLNIPDQAVSDKELNLSIEYQNQSDADFSDVSIKLAYPSGFNFISADPAPGSGNNIWKLGDIKGKASGAIKINGSFSGAQGEVKSMYAEIGQLGEGDQFVSYAGTESRTSLASSALVVFQTVNDSRDYATNPGAVLRYKIRYKNTTNYQISNAVILAGVDDKYVNIKSLNIPWGAFDARTNSIIWNSVGVPDLAVLDPKEEGEVSFSISVKPVFLPKDFSDKNLTIVSTAKITSAAPPEQLAGLPIEGEDRLEAKINTQFSFNEKAYYRDGVIENSGPVPPKVGERTTYAISWQLTTTINDVDDVEVTAVIPPTVEWTGIISPADADIKYNPENGEVKWLAGKVLAGTGIFMPVRKVDFQVAFTPALVHVGDLINLLSNAVLKGTDSFTGMKIERTASQVNSDLLNTLKEGGRVIQ